MSFCGDLQAELDFYKLNVPAREPLAVGSEEMMLTNNDWDAEPILEDLKPVRTKDESDRSNDVTELKSVEEKKVILENMVSNNSNKPEKTVKKSSKSLELSAQHDDEYQHFLGETEATQSQKGRLKMFSCDRCDNSFADDDDLQIHRVNSETCSRHFSCSLCTYVTERKATLKLHFAFEHNITETFSCHHCSDLTPTIESLTRHIHTQHLKTKKYSIQISDHLISDENLLQQSLESYQSEALTCKYDSEEDETIDYDSDEMYSKQFNRSTNKISRTRKDNSSIK